MHGSNIVYSTFKRLKSILSNDILFVLRQDLQRHKIKQLSRETFFSAACTTRLSAASGAPIFVGTRFSRGISSSTWHTCFRVRADDRGKNASGSPSYRKVLRAHVLSRCANARRRWKIFGRGGNEKPDIRAWCEWFFCNSYFTLRSSLFFMRAQDLDMNVFNPPGKKTYR